jgi:hypothetical protein
MSYHVAFWLDEHGLLITQPPRDYRREVQAAERALMDNRQNLGLPRALSSSYCRLIASRSAGSLPIARQKFTYML